LLTTTTTAAAAATVADPATHVSIRSHDDSYTQARKCGNTWPDKTDKEWMFLGLIFMACSMSIAADELHEKAWRPGLEVNCLPE
jgi:hypothetical protein